MILAPLDTACLARRCDAHGWRLAQEGEEWVLYGNGSAASFGRLDALGATLPEAAEAYPALLKSLAEGFRACLGTK